MSIFKIKPEGYSTLLDMENLVSYVFDNKKHTINGFTGGQLLLIGTCDDIMEQILNVKHIYYKMHGRQLRHMVLSLSEEEMQSIGVYELYYISTEICRLLPEYQIGFALHQEKNHLHAHFVLNTVSCYTGLKFQMSRFELREFKKEIASLILRYMKGYVGYEYIENIDGEVEFRYYKAQKLFCRGNLLDDL